MNGPIPANDNGFPPHERPPFRLAPMPIVSGNVTENRRGRAVRIASVTVTVTATDGSTEEISLINAHGGWWPPDAPPVQGMPGATPPA